MKFNFSNFKLIQNYWFIDKYAIACIFYICLLCVWYSLVGSNTIFPDKDFAIKVDFWLFIFFVFLFAIIHVLLVIKFFFALKKIRNIKKKEKKFVIDTSNQNIINSFELFN